MHFKYLSFAAYGKNRFSYDLAQLLVYVRLNLPFQI